MNHDVNALPCINEDFYGTEKMRKRGERANLTRKFTIVAEIVSLLEEIYKRDGPLRAVLKVKTLAILFPPCPREMKTNTAKFKSAAILALACFYGNGATHAHSFDHCGPPQQPLQPTSAAV